MASSAYIPLCDALEVPRGTFYNHILRNKKENKSYQLRRTELSEQIRQIYDESDQIYGAKKISAVLKSRGVATSDKMVSELMQEMNLTSIRTGAKRLYMRFHAQKKNDRLGKQFSASAPNQIWVSDVTYFAYNKKMYYICAPTRFHRNTAASLSHPLFGQLMKTAGRRKV